MNTDLMFSSKNSSWETPQWLFDELDREFNFDLDVAADKHNHKCKCYFTEEFNGLIQPWALTNWMNPPYGREIGKWVKKAYEESLKGSTVVCLLPARTDTKWFHDYIYGKAEIRFIKGRLKFSGNKYNAPFPNMIVIFRGEQSDKPI